MTALPPNVMKYVAVSISTTPILIPHLLRGYSQTDPMWDVRPYPERFTLREALAHLADWEPIWLDRIQRTCTEREPLLPGYDEGKMAIDQDYAHSDPLESIARFEVGRSGVVEYLRALDYSEWERVGVRDELGPISVAGQATLIMAHDGYHVKQILEWLEFAAR